MDKKALEQIPVHETFKIAGLLAVVGGFLDAYTYILRGQVFANAQTGNMVLVAVGMARFDWKHALMALVPIVAFVMGVFVTEIIKKHCQDREFAMWEHLVIIIELVCLFIVGLIPQSVPDACANVLVSFICSVQVCSFRKVRGLGYASTMCTGNLRSGTENLFRAILGQDVDGKKKAAHYFGIILCFILGAFLGGVLSASIGVKCVWFCCIPLAGVFIAMTYTTAAKNRK